MDHIGCGWEPLGIRVAAPDPGIVRFDLGAGFGSFGKGWPTF